MTKNPLCVVFVLTKSHHSMRKVMTRRSTLYFSTQKIHCRISTDPLPPSLPPSPHPPTLPPPSPPGCGQRVVGLRHYFIINYTCYIFLSISCNFIPYFNKKYLHIILRISFTPTNTATIMCASYSVSLPFPFLASFTHSPLNSFSVLYTSFSPSSHFNDLFLH